MVPVPPAHAQLNIAFDWQPPSNDVAFIEELELLRATSAGVLILPAQTDIRRLTHLHSLGIETWLDLGFRFPNRIFFDEGQEEFRNRLNRLIETGKGGTISGIVLMRNGAFYDPGFMRQLEAEANGFAVQHDGLRLYIISNNLQISGLPESVTLIFDGRGRESGPLQEQGILFPPFDFSRTDVRSVQDQLRKLEPREGAVYVFDAGRFLDAALENPDLIGLIREYSIRERPVFPDSEPVARETPANWAVLFLFLIWAAFIVHFRFFPNYQKAVFRYFYSHPFFIVDIFERHLRFGKTALFLLVHFTLAGGVIVLVTVRHLFAGTAHEALLHYIPFAESDTAVFIMSCAFLLVFKLLCIVWVSSASFRADIFSQAASLYVWPFHLNLLFLTLIVVLDASGTFPVTITVVFGLFLLNLVMAFILTGLDFRMRPTLSPFRHVLLTIALYFLLMAGGLAALYFYTDLFETLELLAYLVYWEKG